MVGIGEAGSTLVMLPLSPERCERRRAGVGRFGVSVVRGESPAPKGAGVASASSGASGCGPERGACSAGNVPVAGFGACGEAECEVELQPCEAEAHPAK